MCDVCEGYNSECADCRERRREYQRQHYANLSPEDRAEYRKRKNKWWMNYYYENREKMNARRRERFHNLSPEEKEAARKKRYEASRRWKLKKKAESTQNPKSSAKAATMSPTRKKRIRN